MAGLLLHPKRVSMRASRDNSVEATTGPVGEGGGTPCDYQGIL
jgi:hypothetical protein